MLFSICHLKMIPALKTTKKPDSFLQHLYLWHLEELKRQKQLFCIFHFFTWQCYYGNNARRNDRQTHSSTLILPRHWSLILYLFPVNVIMHFLKLSALNLFTISLLLPSVTLTLKIFILWSLVSYLPNTLLVLNISRLFDPAMLKSRLVQLSTQSLT